MEPGDDGVCIDVETTGLDPERDAVVELGLAIVCAGELAGVWSHPVRPPEEAWEHATKESLRVHGHTRESLATAPTLATAWARGVEWLNSMHATMRPIAHNADFDRRFLARGLQADGPEAPHPWFDKGGTALWTDTLEMARQELGEGRGLARYGLDALAHQMGCEAREANATHGAGTDAELLAKIWIAWGAKGEAPTTLQGDMFAPEPPVRAPDSGPMSAVKAINVNEDEIRLWWDWSQGQEAERKREETSEGSGHAPAR